WMCPLAYGQIQTFFHAGGITSSSMRPSVAASVTDPPLAST
ncbi:MAG: hypothetical protein QOJ34_3247, partial [Pseudonocardiales bacterium]|nr:hypothetical protein [Pseudonocardiales bacterium]